ncbi:MAG: hypothetical protein LQ350_005066 [Teloschistes chrysophthalmus]|nr:MAG: hypothetical protein LQ350_005066 [Niorma chrysophthalma]
MMSLRSIHFLGPSGLTLPSAKSSIAGLWSSDKLHRIADAVAQGKSYQWIEADQAADYLGKPLRSAVDWRQVLQTDGAAHSFFPEDLSSDEDTFSDGHSENQSAAHEGSVGTVGCDNRPGSWRCYNKDRQCRPSKEQLRLQAGANFSSFPPIKILKEKRAVNFQPQVPFLSQSFTDSQSL